MQRRIHVTREGDTYAWDADDPPPWGKALSLPAGTAPDVLARELRAFFGPETGGSRLSRWRAAATAAVKALTPRR